MLRGGFTVSVYCLTMEIPMVGIPDSSITRWTSPTDWLQMAHPGVRRTQSALASFSRAAISGAVISMSV